ncbi:CAP domain-containing protein [Cuneatibacter caecimuris]|uniref:Cysteine-rich secretory family protein n=1 Tax=Cuneatibacter caecimuris TaxID=1796618 RepID=A0A4Q7PLH3_9FIRM|nr:CAP domain-containing protein [Cuneatibacter caecimuris]RZT01187.1 cysteine-rich secretory family protein [Cuneatibacter caecimuris]
MRMFRLLVVCFASMVIIGGCGSAPAEPVISDTLQETESLERFLSSDEEKESIRGVDKFNPKEVRDLMDHGETKKEGEDYRVIETLRTEDGSIISLEKNEVTGETVTVIYNRQEDIGGSAGIVISETGPQNTKESKGYPTGSSSVKTEKVTETQKPNTPTKMDVTNETSTKAVDTKPIPSTPTTVAPETTTAAPSTTATPPTVPTTAVPTTESTLDINRMVQEFLRGLNDERVNRGLGTLTLSPDLTATSQAHANNMAQADTGEPFHYYGAPGESLIFTSEGVGVSFSDQACYEECYSVGRFMMNHARGLQSPNILTVGIAVARGASGDYYFCFRCYEGR